MTQVFRQGVELRTVESKGFGGRSDVRFARLLAVSVLLIGLIVSSIATYSAKSNTERSSREAMDRQSGVATSAVSTEVQRYIDNLHVAAAAVGSGGEINREKLDVITQSLQTANLRGATAVAFIVPSADGDVPAVQAQWRARISPDLTLKPVKGVNEHLFNVYSRNFDGVAPNTGVDVAQAAEPSAAMIESRRSGNIAVSDTYYFLRDRMLPESKQQLSFALAAPVVKAGTNETMGWLLMGMRGQDFVGATLSSAALNSFEAALFATNGKDAQVRVASIGSNVAGDVNRETMINVAQRSWVLKTSAKTESLSGNPTWYPLGIGAAGLFLTLLLAGLVYTLATQRARAERRVAEATTDLQVAEAEARRQTTLLEAIVRSAPDGIAVVNGDGEFLLHNPAAKKLLGVPDVAGTENWQQHYGAFLSDAVTPFPEEDLPVVRALKGESCDDVEMVIRNDARPEGVLISINGRPLDESGGLRGAVALFRDITALREHEKELAAFAGVVAHDLKAPLTSIHGFIELAQDVIHENMSHAEVEVANESIERVVSAVGRMRSLIDDLLTYASARDAELTRTSVDTTALINDVVATRTGHLSDDERPAFYVGELPRVHADESMLRQLFDNLIGNAMKYHMPGDTPRIDVSSRSDRPGWVRIEIADRGIGIPEGQHASIFNGFNRAHRDAEYPGTGLGLAICQRIVDRHGGTIGASDNPGGGTRFFFVLPKVEANNASARFGVPNNEIQSIS